MAADPDDEQVVVLRTGDGCRLVGRLLPARAPAGADPAPTRSAPLVLGPEGTPAAGPGVLLLHGFGMSSERVEVRALAAGLRAAGPVLALDLRGHGASQGRSTLGLTEALDVAAGVAELRRRGCSAVVVVGFSMGGAAALRHAALAARDGAVLGHAVGAGPDAVVAVSTPSRWSDPDSAPLRRLARAASSDLGRRLLRLTTGARVGRLWEPHDAPVDTVALVRDVDVPLLLVHGEADVSVGVGHARSLLLAARTPVALWVVPGMGHAEVGAPPDLGARLAAAVPDLAAGRLPRALDASADAA